MAKAESDILNRWMLKWARRFTMFRNNVGGAWAGTIVKKWKENGEQYITLRGGYWIQFGLIKGSYDWIGWETVTITPDMVGRKIARFTAIEGKTPDGVESEEQKIFGDNVRKAAGMAFIVRSPDTLPPE